MLSAHAMEKIGLKTNLVALEIGSLGHWGMNSATHVVPLLDLPKAEVRSVLDSAAKTASAGSHQLFLASFPDSPLLMF